LSVQLVLVLILLAIFLIATVLPVHMGALGFVAAFVAGYFIYANSEDGYDDTIFGFFPGSLFVVLVGVTYLFAIAKNNGTVDWIVNAAVHAVRGRVALVPWVMFAVCALITSIGAVSPAAVAIIAPIAMGFAARYKIHPMLMGMMVVQGATAGSFSPIGIFGAITNGVVEGNNLPSNRLFLFITTFVAAALIAVVTFLAFGGRELIRRGKAVNDERELERLESEAVALSVAATQARVTGTPEAAIERGKQGRSGGPGAAAADDAEGIRLNAEKSLTLIGLAALAVGALAFNLDVGFTALAVAVALTLVFPASARGAVDKISWGTVLLIGGIVTYVALLEEQGTVQWLGDGVAKVGAPLIAALLICLIGAVVSAFASTTGILGALIPLAVPFLMTDQVSAVGLVAALAISSSVVDCSPFSTNGALVVANAEAEQRDMTFRRLMQWGMSIVVIAPLVSWAVLVVPGSL
jgi:di/tricarboxylate transporter